MPLKKGNLIVLYKITMEDQSKETVEETTTPTADVEATNNDSSELVEDQSNNLEELEQEKTKLQENLKRAEEKIVKLKKSEPSLDLESLKGDILKEVEVKFKPQIDDLNKLKTLEKENRELKEAMSSKGSVSKVSEGESINKVADNKPKPTKKDLELANKYFRGDIDKYMKYKKQD